MTETKDIGSATTAIRWAQYVLFWGVSFIILSRYFSYQDEVSSIDVIYTGLFHISLLFSVCINSYLLIPRLLAKQKFFTYALLLIITLLASTWLNIYTFRYLTDWILPGYYFISYYAWSDIIQFIIVYVTITTLLQLSRSWFREVEIKQELTQARQEQTETELKALRAQINPHFLFNSLNHIYALAVQKSPQTASAILKLSDLLRYAIKNIDQKKVSLSDELNYINEFIALLKSRVQHPEKIHVQIDETKDNLKIAPLLLIVFIENCFKHGSISNPNEYIKITILVDDANLKMETQNFYEKKRELPEKAAGLGLENVKRRLKLLYPDKHKLAIKQEGNIFITKLKLYLS